MHNFNTACALATAVPDTYILLLQDSRKSFMAAVQSSYDALPSLSLLKAYCSRACLESKFAAV